MDPKRYGVKALCALFDVSKQAYYKQAEDNVLHKAAQESFALEYIKVHTQKRPRDRRKEALVYVSERLSREQSGGTGPFCGHH